MALTPEQRDQMAKDLMERTQQSYERKDGDSSNRYFDPDLDIPFYKPEITKGKPHIIDILPWFAGPNFPTKPQPTPEGKWVYVLDLWVHKKVGPGKVTVVCPARNYGNRCPICEHIDDLIREGAEYEDIAFSHKRQCSYNVLVMDDEQTEAKGIQVWDVSYKYSEKAIVTAAVNARGGGVIPFANPDHRFGRSLVFDVAKDKYKTISGHRFELRDYDIPEEILEECFPLDAMIKIYTYDELFVLLHGEGGKPASEGGGSLRRTLTRRDGEGTTQPESQPAAGGTTRRLITKAAEDSADKCPVGAKFGYDFNKYGDCDTCDDKQRCAEALDMIEYKASKAMVEPVADTVQNPPAAIPQQETPPSAGTGAVSGRRLLLRRNK